MRIELPETLPLLQVDGRLIEQVLENLLDNASKYTPAGSEIRISAQQLTRQIEISVEDDGPGLPAAIRRSCSRNSSAARRKARSAASASAWRSAAPSSPCTMAASGRRTARRTARRFASAAAAASKPTRRDRVQTCRARMTVASRAVLIVEDDAQIRRVLRTLLELEQFRVIEAETAERGLMRGAHPQA